MGPQEEEVGVIVVGTCTAECVVKTVEGREIQGGEGEVVASMRVVGQVAALE